MSAPTAAAPADWTRDPKSGRSNSSAEYRRLCGEVERLIRESGFHLVNGHADAVAGLIVAQLAHVHGLAPRTALLDEALVRAGTQMSNICFNLAQLERMGAEHRASMDAARRAWDDALLDLTRGAR